MEVKIIVAVLDDDAAKQDLLVLYFVLATIVTLARTKLFHKQFVIFTSREGMIPYVLHVNEQTFYLT